MLQYEKVIQSVISMIHQGLLKEGERIPSVRKMSDRIGCSINSVKEAYIRLEQLRYIYSIPQSGYYVRPLQDEFQAQPALDPSTLNPKEVGLCRIYSSYKEQDSVEPLKSLGIATIDPSLYPVENLSKIIREIMRNNPDIVMDYQIPPGYLPLREQIARQSIEWGAQLSPDDIVITNGCNEALYLMLSAVCKPGDVIAIESPCYFSLFDMLGKLGLKVIEIPASAEQGIPLETLSFILENYKISAMITVSNFSNPLGFSHSKRQKISILELLKQHNVPLIEDDIYSELYFGKHRPESYYSLASDNQEVYLCSSYSKTLGPGFRIGWLCPRKYKENVIHHKTLLNLGSAALPQIVIANYLQQGYYNRHLRKIRTFLSSNGSRLRKSLLEYLPKGTRISNPQGGVVLWVTLPAEYNTMELYQEALKRGILIAPGTLFSQRRDYSSSFRINGGFKLENSDELAKEFSDILSKVSLVV